MPIRIIDRQAAVARVGKIRMGEKRVSTRTKAEYPAQRETFRFTSANKAAIEMLKLAYGGEVRPWKDHPGEWELDSTSGQISVIVDTALSVDDTFEKYDGKTRTHKCDGLNCEFFEMKRDRDGKIIHAQDMGLVGCRCNPDGQGPDPENKGHCDLKTTLRVMIPATGDVMLWEFASKGVIFNSEVRGAVDTFRSMGIRHGYCHLSINLLEKVRGNDVSKFGVARLTLDPNPPNFVAQLLANTPEAQAKALLMGGEMPPQPVALPNAAPQLPQNAGTQATDQADRKKASRDRAKAIVDKHSLTADQFKEIALRTGLESEAYIDFLEMAAAEGNVGYAPLLLITAPADPAPQDVDAYLLEVMGTHSLVKEFKEAAGEQWAEKAKAAQAAKADTYDKLIEIAKAPLQEALL
jgi:hypothetical protein